MCCIYFDPVFKTVLLKRIFENVVSFWRSRSNFQLAPGWGALDPAPGAKGAFIICLKMAYRFVKYCRRKKFVLKSLVWGLKFKVYLFSLSCRFWVEQEPKPVLQSTLGFESSQKRPAPAPLRNGKLRLRSEKASSGSAQLRLRSAPAPLRKGQLRLCSEKPSSGSAQKRPAPAPLCTFWPSF